MIAIGRNSFPSIAGEREDRQVDDRDDRLAEDARGAHLERRVLDDPQALAPSERRPALRACASERRRDAFSTMMTAPSTMSPKSIAPRLIRLPEMPGRVHHDDREEHRQRDRRRDDEPRAEVAEQEEEHER